MQRALHAMTMKQNGDRIASGWQFETAKRALRDLKDDAEAQIEWRKKYIAAKAANAKRAEDKVLDEILHRREEKHRLHIAAETTRDRGELAAIASGMLKRRPKVKHGQFVPMTTALKERRAEREARRYARAFPDVAGL